jgi:fructose-bisphosphate aldolase class I
MEDIVATALALVAPGRGLLAMDESNGTCNERFARWGITQSVENRRAYREMIVTTSSSMTRRSGNPPGPGFRS